MKNRKNILTLLLLILSVSVYSQTFDNVLKIIKQNNLELKAGSKYVESKTFEYKQNNLPDGPELKYGYFPKNNTVTGTKEVFEVSQSFQMPCFYRNQSVYSKLMIKQEETNHQILRQNILSEAKNLIIEYVYLIKQISITDKRLKFADDIHNAYLVRIEAGDANILEVNKAKLHLLQVKKHENNLRTEILAVKEKLTMLNGGIDIKIDINEYPLENIVELDSILFDRLENDPVLIYNQNAFEASMQRIKVAKNMQLPKFSLGYGTETVVDEKFKGFLVGLSIPLWGSKRSIQQSKAESDFYSLNKVSISENKITETRIQFKKVNSLQQNLESYRTVLGSIYNEDLLNKSLELGEISVIEFFTEMFYFYEIYDDYLLVEKEYHQALSELYKYKL